MAMASIRTPIGTVQVDSDGGAVTSVRWGLKGAAIMDAPSDPVLVEAIDQLDAYFAQRLDVFSLPLSIAGSEFQRRVCEAMQNIPHGETRTYGDLAQICEAPAQAIGAACGGNPIPVIIPCHRVLGANGLGGYSGAGGIETKVWLLRHEGAAGLLI